MSLCSYYVWMVGTWWFCTAKKRTLVVLWRERWQCSRCPLSGSCNTIHYHCGSNHWILQCYPRIFHICCSNPRIVWTIRITHVVWEQSRDCLQLCTHVRNTRIASAIRVQIPGQVSNMHALRVYILEGGGVRFSFSVSPSTTWTLHFMLCANGS